MTERVDFYVLKRADPKARQLFACRLAEKAYLKKFNVLVLAADEAQARAMDDLLWTFNDDSFVPHALGLNGESDPLSPVTIATEPGSAAHADLVLNLGEHGPDSLQRFARVAEVIDADQERRRRGRERFKTYRDAQVTLETHQLDE